MVRNYRGIGIEKYQYPSSSLENGGATTTGPAAVAEMCGDGKNKGGTGYSTNKNREQP
jgi:hypothetical protein